MAAPLWNQRNLISPPILHLPVSFMHGENVTRQKYQAILNDMATELRLLNTMQKETWILQRVVDKYEASERNMKLLREVKSLCNCCQRIFRLKIPDVVLSVLPETDNKNISGTNRWPSCQMLEYLLVRLIGFAALCQYIWSMGYKTNQLLLQNIEKKILFYRHLNKIASISRMQIIAEHLLEKSCQWYQALHPWLLSLPKLEAAWLPEGVSLPKSIDEVLGSRLIELRNIVAQRGTKTENQNKFTLEKIFGMREDDSDDLLPQMVISDNHVSKRPVKKEKASHKQYQSLSLDDIFTGLVDTPGSIQAKKKSTQSFLNQQSEDGGAEDSITHQSILQNGRAQQVSLTTKEPTMVHNSKEKITSQDEIYSPNQSEDLGVPVSREEQRETGTKVKKKKKSLKRKRTENDINADVSKRRKELSMQNEEKDNLHVEKDKASEDHEVKTDVKRETGEVVAIDEDEATSYNNRKKKKKKRKNKNRSEVNKDEKTLLETESLDSSNLVTDDTEKRKSQIGNQTVINEAIPPNTNDVRKRKGKKLEKQGRGQPGEQENWHDSMSASLLAGDRNLELRLEGAGEATYDAGSNVILKKKKKRKKKQINEEDALRYSTHAVSMETARTGDHNQGSVIKQEKKRKKKNRTNQSFSQDQLGEVTSEVNEQTDTVARSEAAELTDNNDWLAGIPMAEISSVSLDSERKKQKKKRRKKGKLFNSN